MSVDKKLLHLRSNQANNYPTGDKTLSGTPIMDYGEIAINYAHDNEFMSIRNSDNKLVLFKPWTFIEQIIKENELVTAASLTQIKDSCGFNEYGEYIPSGSTHFISETKTITEALNTLDAQIQLDYNILNEAIDELSESVEGSNKVTAAALTRLKESCGFDENGNFIPNIEILNGVESLGGAIEVIANNTQAMLQNIQTTLDGYTKKTSFDELKHDVEILEQNHIDSELVTATALTQLKNSCGFNDYGEYQPNSNTIISGCSNITEAIDVLANTASNTNDSLNTRNLLLNTNQGSRGWRFANGSLGVYTLGSIKDEGINCFHFKYDDNSAITSSTWEIFQYQLRPELIQAGKTYTCSFDIKQIRNTDDEIGLKWQFAVMNGNAASDSILSPLTPQTYNVSQLDTWEHIVINFTPTKSGTQDGIQVVYLGVHSSLRGLWSELLIKNLQVVEGETDCDWTPAPEDLTKVIADNEVKAYIPDIYYGETYKLGNGTIQQGTNQSTLRTNPFVTLGPFVAKFQWESNPGGTLTVHSWDSQGIYQGNATTAVTAGTLDFDWSLLPSENEAYYAFDYQATNVYASLVSGNMKVGIIYKYADDIKATNERLTSEIERSTTADTLIQKSVPIISYVRGGEAPFIWDNSLFNVSESHIPRIMYAVSGLESGEEVTISFDYEVSGVDFSAENSRIFVENHGQWGYSTLGFFLYGNSSGHHSYTMNVPENVTKETINTPYISLSYINGDANSVIKITNFKVVKGRREKEEYANVVSLLDLQYRMGYNLVTTVTSLPVTKRTVLCNATTSQTFSFSPKDIMPNGEEMHILVYNAHASNNITITFDSTFVKLSGDSLTIPAGEYGEINVLRIDNKYYLRTI